MKDMDQIKSIARAMGWKQVERGWKSPVSGCVYLECELPTFAGDFTNDLNAMYKAEEWLLNKSRSQDTDVLWSRYSHFLDEVGICIKFHATAAQRAMAMLKALGMWRDE